MPATGLPVAGAPLTAPAVAPVVFDPYAACQQSLAQAAYPIVNQMLWFTQVANAYPMTPNGRPYVGPAVSYPGIGPLFGPGGGPYTQFANTLGGASLASLYAASQPIVPFVPTNGNGEAAAVVAELTGNVFNAAGLRLATQDTRLAAAEVNAGLTSFPREQAVNLKDVLEGLIFYRDIACTRPEPPNGNGHGNGHENGNGHANGNGNGNGNGFGVGDRP
jgi:hypothetical protein